MYEIIQAGRYENSYRRNKIVQITSCNTSRKLNNGSVKPEN